MTGKGSKAFRRPSLLVIAGALLIAGAALFLLLRDPDPVNLSSLEESAFKEFEVGGVPRSIAVTTDGIWVARADRTVVQLDPADGMEVAKIRLPFLPGQMISTGETLWVGAIEGNTIARVDPDTAKILDQIEVGTTPQSLASDPDTLYVAAFDDGVVKRLDIETGRVLGDAYRDSDAFPSSVVAAFGGLWVSDVVLDVVTRVPAPTGDTREVEVGDSPTRLVADHGAIWAANFNDRSVSRIDPASDDPPQEILVGGKPGAMTEGDGYIWVLRPGSDSFVLIDTDANRWTGEVYGVAEAPQDITSGHGYFWIASHEGTLTRVPRP